MYGVCKSIKYQLHSITELKQLKHMKREEVHLFPTKRSKTKMTWMTENLQVVQSEQLWGIPTQKFTKNSKEIDKVHA